MNDVTETRLPPTWLTMFPQTFVEATTARPPVSPGVGAGEQAAARGTTSPTSAATTPTRPRRRPIRKRVGRGA